MTFLKKLQTLLLVTDTVQRTSLKWQVPEFLGFSSHLFGG